MQRRILLTGALGFAVCPGLAAAADAVWDVIVAGSGLAGLSAAASALESGAERVLVLEKGPVIGGHSAMSSGSLAVVSPRRQVLQPVGDSVEQLVKDSRRVGGRINEALIRTIGEKSEAAADWLEAMGVPFSDVIFQAAGGLRPRCISVSGGAAGRIYVEAVNRYARVRGMQLQFASTVAGLERFSDRWRVTVRHTVTGKERSLSAKTVVLATGGFTANVGMRMQFDARLDADMQTTANPHGLYFDGATGDGIRLAERLGAATADMDKFLLLAYSGGRLLEYAGAEVYLTMQGERFVNEAASTGEIAETLFALPEKAMWVVTDSRSVKGASLGLKLANGYVKKSDSIAEMARGMGITTSQLQSTLENYNRHAKKGDDPLFGKSIFLQSIEKPPFYWGMETLNVHNSLGGLVINKEGAVLRKDGTVIDGLFAAGETTGGIFGRDRLGGMALTSALVMGREAGQFAARRALVK